LSCKGQQTLHTKADFLSYFSPLGLICTQSVWIIVQHNEGFSWRYWLLMGILFIYRDQ
jgi:hypothetical protein